MPEVFTRGFLVDFLYGPASRRQPASRLATGTTGRNQIDANHVAETPPRLEVTAAVELFEVERRHERFMIKKEEFYAKLDSKRGKLFPRPVNPGCLNRC